MQIAGLIWEAVISQRTDETKARLNELHANMEELLDLRAETPDYEVPSPEDLGTE
jgi:hypothetical protein